MIPFIYFGKESFHIFLQYEKSVSHFQFSTDLTVIKCVVIAFA